MTGPDPTDGRRTPVVLLDTIGYAFYQDADGRRYLQPDRYEVRLVTDRNRLAEAAGAELSVVVGVDKHDEHALGDAVRFMTTFGATPATRLVAVTERMLLPAARLRQELALPGASVAETVLFRDKVAMKEHLRVHGIAVPAFAPLRRGSAEALLVDHGAVVVKPRLGTGAVGVSVVRDRDTLDALLTELADRLDGYEVERFVAGDLFHVDSVVRDGAVLTATASRYLDETTSYLQRTPSRSVSVPAGDLLDRLLDFNRRVLACYPTYTGATHHEMFVSGSDVVFCEIAARAGGGGVIAGFRSRTGIDLDEVAVSAQLGGDLPHLDPPAPHLTGFVVVYAEPTVLRRPLDVPDEPWVLEAQVPVRPGDVIAEPVNCNDAVAIVSVRGDTEDEVITRMATVVDRVRASLTTDPCDTREGT
jgi:biotin carboxylase